MPFITFEGIEGSGKSTQLARLAERVGARALVTREPGGTTIGVAIRALLLDPANHGMSPLAELLLYFADRAQHVAEQVRPALGAGRLVLCDRYVESSLAYQGYGRGLPLAPIRQLASLATGDLRPDVIVLLDVPVAVGLGRVGRRGGHDRLEREVVAFHERVRAGFLALRAEEPSRWLQLDGTQAEDVVFRELQDGLAARALLGDGPR
jgi:dTMP kinase